MPQHLFVEHSDELPQDSHSAFPECGKHLSIDNWVSKTHLSPAGSVPQHLPLEHSELLLHDAHSGFFGKHLSIDSELSYTHLYPSVLVPQHLCVEHSDDLVQVAHSGFLGKHFSIEVMVLKTHLYPRVLVPRHMPLEHSELLLHGTHSGFFGKHLSIDSELSCTHLYPSVLVPQHLCVEHSDEFVQVAHSGFFGKHLSIEAWLLKTHLYPRVLVPQHLPVEHSEELVQSAHSAFLVGGKHFALDAAVSKTHLKPIDAVPQHLPVEHSEELVQTSHSPFLFGEAEGVAAGGKHFALDATVSKTHLRPLELVPQHLPVEHSEEPVQTSHSPFLFGEAEGVAAGGKHFALDAAVSKTHLRPVDVVPQHLPVEHSEDLVQTSHSAFPALGVAEGVVAGGKHFALDAAVSKTHLRPLELVPQHLPVKHSEELVQTSHSPFLFGEAEGVTAGGKHFALDAAVSKTHLRPLELVPQHLPVAHSEDFLQTSHSPFSAAGVAEGVAAGGKHFALDAAVSNTHLRPVDIVPQHLPVEHSEDFVQTSHSAFPVSGVAEGVVAGGKHFALDAAVSNTHLRPIDIVPQHLPVEHSEELVQTSHSAFLVSGVAEGVVAGGKHFALDAAVSKTHLRPLELVPQHLPVAHSEDLLQTSHSPFLPAGVAEGVAADGKHFALDAAVSKTHLRPVDLVPQHLPVEHSEDLVQTSHSAFPVSGVAEGAVAGGKHFALDAGVSKTHLRGPERPPSHKPVAHSAPSAQGRHSSFFRPKHLLRDALVLKTHTPARHSPARHSSSAAHGAHSSFGKHPADAAPASRGASPQAPRLHAAEAHCASRLHGAHSGR